MKHFATDINSVTGAREDYFWDEQAQRMTIRNRHDVTDIVEGNKAQQNNTIDSRYGKEMLHHVADIPLALYMKWKKEEGVDVLDNTPGAKKFLRRKLNDPDFRFLKTTVKKV
jgi:hypothetical protein